MLKGRVINNHSAQLPVRRCGQYAVRRMAHQSCACPHSGTPGVSLVSFCGCTLLPVVLLAMGKPPCLPAKHLALRGTPATTALRWHGGGTQC